MSSTKKEEFSERDEPLPDPCLDEKVTPWATLHSLSSVKLTLRHILRNCLIPRTPLLVEFPLKTEIEPTDAETSIQLRTQPPIARLQKKQLPLKVTQLKSTKELYKERLDHLQSGSREIFGEIWGHRVCLMVDTSSKHAYIEKIVTESESSEDENEEEGEEEGSREGGNGEKDEEQEERKEFTECRQNLQELFREQLSKKHKIYLMQLSSDDPDDDNSPTPLNFKKNKKRSIMVAEQWVESLKGKDSVCSLLPSLEKGLSINNIDTLLIVVGSKPLEEKEEVVEYLKRRNCDNHTHIHWVAHKCDNATKDMLVRVASETGAHYHSYSQCLENTEKLQIKDTEVDVIKSELGQAIVVIEELEELQTGTISANVLHTLIQLNMTCRHFEFGSEAVTSNKHLPITSRQWLASKSLKALGLSIYDVLAPNAYRQVKTRVSHTPDTSSIIPSVVYDEAMPQMTWHDGSLKYLHVDVHLLEDYQMKIEQYISDLRERINWLASGSRAPFGIISEEKVQLVVEFSAVTLPFVSYLQNSLCLLLREQFSHTQQFNLTRIGDGCSFWRPGLSQTTPQSLSEAWVWLLRQTASGPPPRLIPVLEATFSAEDDAVGVYLILSSLPAENIKTICRFLQEKTAEHQNIHVHVVFYQWSPPSDSHAVAGIRFEEGYYANEQELTRSLEHIAAAGNGRFHKFKGPDGVTGDDVVDLVKELQIAQEYWTQTVKILEEYRTFCKRFVPAPVPAPPTPPPTEPPPLYSRPTTSFFCRLNSARRRIPRSVSDSQLSRPCPRHSKKHVSTRRTKTYGFYLDQRLDKGFALGRKFSTIGAPDYKHKTQSSREPRSISEWLSKNSVESLKLNFSQFEVFPKIKKKTYKHINKQGEVVELCTDNNGLKIFVQQVKKAKENYQQKLYELGTGWQNVLGWISKSKVLVLIDVSSSMAREFEELKSALLDLLQHKPNSLKQLNLMAYSSSVEKWQDSLCPVGEEDEDSEENLSSAAQWVEELRPEGGSCLLHALKLSLESRCKTLYLITDGKSDHTHEFLLSQLPQLRLVYGHSWRINTIAFHCLLQSSVVFLKELAHRTGGRYHCYPWGSADEPTHTLLENKNLGDDIKSLVQEIATAEEQLNNALCYL